MSTDAQTGANRLPPPPRLVAASQHTHVVRLVFAAFAVLVAIATSFGLLTGLLRLHRNAQRHQCAGQIVAKESPVSGRAVRFQLRYRFAPNGQAQEGTARVSGETFHQVKVGDPCTVAYLPDHPENSRLEKPEALEPRRPRDLASLLRVAFGFAAMVAVPWAIFEWVVGRQRHLARTGVLTTALIRERFETAQSRGGAVSWVRYDYLPPGRRRREHGRCPLQQVAWELYPEGTQAPMLVAPHRPGRHKLLAAFTLVRFREPAPQELLDLWAPLPSETIDPAPVVSPVADALCNGRANARVIDGPASANGSAEPFLRAIHAAAGDDGPRLVYADWLDEQGDPRGEFVRLQIELMALDERDPRYVRLRVREEELWRDHGAVWARGLPAIAGVSWMPFVRGFPCVVTVNSLATFVVRAAELFAAAPVCGLRLRLDRPVGEPVHSFMLPLDLSTFAAVPETARLSFLDFSGARLDLAGVETLVSGTRFSRLKSLILDDTGLGNANLVPLARSPALAGLRVLSLRENNLHNHAARVLATAPHLSRLTVLNLHNNCIGIDGARALATRRWLAQLRCLDLGGNWLTTEEMRELQMRWGRTLRL